MTSEWVDRKADIERMVEAEMTDEEIGSKCGKTGPAMFHIRKKLGIPSNYRPVGNRFQKNIDALDTPEPPIGEPYFNEELGRIVIRYPKRWAAGALVQAVTARPKR